MNTLRLRTALLGSGAAIALLAATGPVAADGIDDLRAQINALQDKVTQIQADDTAKPRVAPAAAVNAGSKPKSWQLPGSNTSMAIGGYAKLDAIYDLNSDSGPFLGDGAPEGTSAANKQGAVRLHARQSRLFVKTWTPTDWGELATHLEFDFFGAGGNEVVTNSNTFRARHAYGRLGPILAGQTWSTSIDLGAYPEILDFHGPAGERFIRQGQIRYTHNLGNGAKIKLAVENPEHTFRTDVANAAIGATAVDHVPDFVVMATKNFSGGHIAAMFTGRYLSVDTGGAGGVAFEDSEFGWSGAISGSYNITPNDTWKFAFSYGDGAGRYQLDGVGIASVIVTPVSSLAPELRTVTVFGGQTSIRHKWNATTRSNLVFGSSKVDLKDELPNLAAGGQKAAIVGVVPDRRNSIHANLIWSPVPQVNVGVEYIWQQTSYHNSANGRTSRIHLAMQYKF
jgi:hypothetical protein